MKTRRKFILFFICCFFLGPLTWAQGEEVPLPDGPPQPPETAPSVYRWKDSDGVIHFSDKPAPGSQKMDIAPVQTYQTPQDSTDSSAAEADDSNATAQQTPAEEVVPNYQIYFIKPTNEENLPPGESVSVPVELFIQPKLRDSDSITLLLDGRVFQVARTTTFTLENLDRGAHTLQAQISDKEGKVVKESPTLNFYIQRPTLLGQERAKSLRQNALMPVVATP